MFLCEFDVENIVMVSAPHELGVLGSLGHFVRLRQSMPLFVVSEAC